MPGAAALVWDPIKKKYVTPPGATAPAPVAPAPIAPKPITPAPMPGVAPAPVAPKPITPAPITPAPVAPKPISSMLPPATITPTVPPNAAMPPAATAPNPADQKARQDFLRSIGYTGAFDSTGGAHAYIEQVFGPGTTWESIKADPNAAMQKAIDAEIAKQKADPNYGALTKNYKEFTPYKDFTPYQDYKPLTASDLPNDPGYQFRLDQGNKAINAAQAARGGFYSGRALKEADAYNSGQASQEFGNAYNRNMQDYTTGYNKYNQDYTTGYNKYNQDYTTGYNKYSQDQNNLYNRLNGLSTQGAGLTTQALNANELNASALGGIYGNLGNAQGAYSLDQGNNMTQLLSQLLGSSQYGRK